MNNPVNGIAVIRAFAKARVGDAQALRWLIEQSKAGNVAAVRAIEDYQRLCGDLDPNDKPQPAAFVA